MNKEYMRNAVQGVCTMLCRVMKSVSSFCMDSGIKFHYVCKSYYFCGNF
jgi:hypothetical protein